mmetsp:Transcript_81330/g.230442  ORF Transcript_81330/g.230442 Transcript_81330/m.230442 type:complete len:324 (-) Transcript_81330:975-1946(-)
MPRRSRREVAGQGFRAVMPVITAVRPQSQRGQIQVVPERVGVELDHGDHEPALLDDPVEHVVLRLVLGVHLRQGRRRHPVPPLGDVRVLANQVAPALVDRLHDPDVVRVEGQAPHVLLAKEVEQPLRDQRLPQRHDLLAAAREVALDVFPDVVLHAEECHALVDLHAVADRPRDLDADGLHPGLVHEPHQHQDRVLLLQGELEGAELGHHVRRHLLQLAADVAEALGDDVLHHRLVVGVEEPAAGPHQGLGGHRVELRVQEHLLGGALRHLRVGAVLPRAVLRVAALLDDVEDGLLLGRGELQVHLVGPEVHNLSGGPHGVQA